MPNSYVEDYESVTGQKPDADAKPAKQATAKVVEAPAKQPAKRAAAKPETK